MVHNTINSFISVLVEVAKRDDVVVWIRTPNYRKQLYVSLGFETIWGRSTEELYKHPWRWGEFLVQEEFEQKMQELAARNPESLDSNQKKTYFRIKRPDGMIKHLRDKAFHFYDENYQVIAIGGISTLLTPEQWEIEVAGRENIQKEHDDALLIAQILKSQDKPSSLYHLPDGLPEQYVFLRDGQYIGLTVKEMECLRHMITGLTAKEIARELKISYRTVEKHLASIKEKLSCRNKAEIYQKIHPTSFNSIYLQPD